MKKILVLLCLIILSTNIYSQEIQIGSTLKTLSNNISADDFVNSEDLGLWSENKIFAYKIGNENRLLVSMNHYPFAVLTKKNGENIGLRINQ